MDHLFRNLSAALFDLDGTLVETNIDFALMKRRSIDFAKGCGLQEAGLSNLDVLSIVKRIEDSIRSSSGGSAAESATAQAMRILEEIELHHASSAKEILPARELVETLKSLNIRVGIVTRNCRSASEKSLVRVGIFPDTLLCREDVAHTKPDPDHLIAALEILQAAPGDSVMIGDHPMDITAGKAAGMRTIRVMTRECAPDCFDKVEPDAVAHNLSDILGAVVNSHPPRRGKQ